MKRFVRFEVLRVAWCGGFFILSVLSAWGQTMEQAPLVKKKLFVPMTEAGPGSAGPQLPVVDGRFVLTGVMVRPDGKKALIEIRGDPAAAKDGSPKGWHGEGDSVGGYLVESIEPNAVILAGNNQKVRVPLYGTPKERPHPLATASAGKKEPSRPDQAAGSKGPQGAAGGGGGSKSPSNVPPQAPSAVPPGPSMEAPHQGSQESPQGPSAGASAPAGFMNPFAEALRKAQEAQKELSQPPAGGAPAGGQDSLMKKVP